MKTLMVFAGVAALILCALFYSPVSAAVTPEEVSGLGREELSSAFSGPVNNDLAENVTAAQTLFLPLILKNLPLTPGILFVLINNFLLFVPAPL